MTLRRFIIRLNGCQLIISLIHNPCQDFLNNKPKVESNFAFIGPVSTVDYGGQAGYATISMIT